MPLMPPAETRRTSRRPLLLALVGLLAVVAGLLVPAPPAQAAYPYLKPAWNSVKAVSGSNALKVAWKAVTAIGGGENASTFRVYYNTTSTRDSKKFKTVDMSLGRANNNNGSTTGPYYILTGLDPSRTYHVWVQPWNTTTNTASGPVSDRRSAKTSKYAYKPPVTLTAINPGRTSMELSWRTVTGAPTYRIRAVGGGQTLYASSGAEGSLVVKGLKSNTDYTFTVSVEQPPVSGVPAYIKMSAESKAKARAKTLSSSLLPAITDLATREDPTDEFDKNGQRPWNMDLSFVVPAGFDAAAGDRFQIDVATDQEMKANKNYFRLGPDDGDGIPERNGGDGRWGEWLPDPLGPTMVGEPQQSPGQVDAQSQDAGDSDNPGDEPTTTPTPAATGTPVPTATGTPVPTATATAEPTATPEPSETPTPTETPTPSGDPSPTAGATEGADAEQLAAPVLPDAPSTGTQRLWTRIYNLNSNKNWYLRIKVIRYDEARKMYVQRSERTEALMAKTLSPKGYITGVVSRPTGSGTTWYRDYVVSAYRGTDVHDQVSLASDGSYKLTVRPGAYYVQSIYIGTGNFASLWASTKEEHTNGGRVRAEASGVAVEVGKAVTAATIRPSAGYTISGDIDCPDAQDQCYVNVAAMSDIGGGRGTVIRQVESNANGNYTITGLAAGTYRLRISHREDRYKVLTLRPDSVHSANPSETGVDGSLSPRGWVKKYTTKISGTKRVGKTLKLSSKAWIASELPVVRAVPKCQWQRNGANISGATRCSYKLTSADRGKSVRVRVHNYRYGFESNTTYSKAYRIG